MKDHTEGKGSVLAIESAVADGSIALLTRGSKPIVRSEGSGSSRAEKILSVIDSLLAEAGTTPDQLDAIAVSVGPGSYSGIRIGISTALGLSDAVGTACIGVSVLAAMADSAPAAGSLVVAVPVGKTDVAWQHFDDGKPTGEPSLSSAAGFAHELSLIPEPTIFVQSELLARIEFAPVNHERTIDAGRSLAEFVGKFALQAAPAADSTLRPIYLRNKEAARPGAF